MILDTVRAVADWLSDGTYGINAALAALDLDGADTAPAGTYAIIDETRDDDATIGRDGTRPFVRVAAGEVRSLDGQAATYTHDADVPLELLICRATTSPAATVRDLYYTVRATCQVLERLFGTSAAAVAARTRNQVQLSHIENLSTAQVRVELGDTPATAAVMVTIRVRDLIA